MGSSDSLKSLLTTMVTAGAMNQLGDFAAFGDKKLSAITLADGPLPNLGKNLITQVSSATLNTVLTGASLEDGLKSALLNGVITTGGAFGARYIGDLADTNGSNPPVLNSAGQAVAHALLGCVTGQLSVGDCGSGAAGGVVGELAAAWFNPTNDQSVSKREETIKFAGMVAGLAGAISKGDGSASSVKIAAQVGANAAENNYVSHSPFANVRRTISAENARLMSECGANCTLADMRRIDQQMVRLETAANLAAISQTTSLTTAQAMQLAETVAALLPVYGTPLALYRAISGQSLTGQELGVGARLLDVAAAALPLGSAAYKLVLSATQDMAKMSASIGAIQGFKSAEEVNGVMTAFNKSPAWKEGTQIAEATLQPGTKVQMVVDKVAFDKIRDGEMDFVGNWASFDNIPSQAFARNQLAITKEFKQDVGYLVELEVVKPIGAQIGVVGAQGVSNGGANQLNFLFEQRNGGEFFRLVAGKVLP